MSQPEVPAWVRRVRFICFVASLVLLLTYAFAFAGDRSYVARGETGGHLATFLQVILVFGGLFAISVAWLYRDATWRKRQRYRSRRKATKADRWLHETGYGPEPSRRSASPGARHLTVIRPTK